MARNVKWSLEEHIAMIFAEQNGMSHNETAEWVNMCFGNNRTRGAVENQMYNLRGNLNGTNTATKFYQQRIKEIEACGFEIPREEQNETLFLENKLLREQNALLNELLDGMKKGTSK